MSLEVAIHENTAAIRELITKLTAAGMSQQAAAGTIMHAAAEESFNKPETTKIEKPAAAKKPDAKTASPAPGAKPQSAAPKDDAPASELTYEDAKQVLLTLSKEKGREPTVALLARFGATRGPDLKPEQWADFIRDAKRTIAGEYDPEKSEPDEEESLA